LSLGIDGGHTATAIPRLLSQPLARYRCMLQRENCLDSCRRSAPSARRACRPRCARNIVRTRAANGKGARC
jgi:hypothetical protein